MPDVEETADSRARVGKWLNAETHPVHVEGEGESRRLVTRGGTDVATHVARSNGDVFYEAHGGSRKNRTGDSRKLERMLEVATPKGGSHYLGEAAASSLMANSFKDARTVTILACNYGKGDGKALSTMAEKFHEEGAPGVTIRAPTVPFARQTLPGPGVAPSKTQRQKLAPIDRRRETMTKPENTQLEEMLSTRFWRSADSGSAHPPAFPKIADRELAPAKRAQSQPPGPTKPRWR